MWWNLGTRLSYVLGVFMYGYRRYRPIDTVTFQLFNWGAEDEGDMAMPSPNSIGDDTKIAPPGDIYNRTPGETKLGACGTI